MRVIRPAREWAVLSFVALALLIFPTAAWCQPWQNLPRYDLRVKALPNSLSVGLDVVLPAEATPRRSLKFELLPSMGTPEVRQTGQGNGVVLSIRKVDESKDQYKPRVTWEIDPQVPFPANRPIHLRINYHGGGGGALVYYVGPEIIIASGLVQPWFPQFSKEKLVGSLSLDLPANFVALAPGDRLVDEVKGDRRSTIFRMNDPTRVDLVAAPFKVIQAKQEKGDVPVSLYLLKDRDFAGDLVDLVRRSVKTLEAEFGPFPVKQFAVVEFPTDPGNKASFSGASVDGYILMRTDDLDTKRADPSASFFGHEIGHQWWGVSVSYTGGDGGDFMLDEALAEYGRLRVVEALQGAEGAKAFRAEQRNKVLRRIAAGYDGALNGMPKPTPAQSQFMYQDLARAKGTLAYDVLSRSIGPVKMRAFFREIQATYGHSSRITWHEFVAHLMRVAGPGHQAQVRQWLDLNGLPVLNFKWTARKAAVAIDIGQTHPGIPAYDLSLPVRIVYDDESTDIKAVTVAARALTSVVLPVSKPVARVEFDPDRTLPWVTEEEFKEAAAIKNFTLAWQLWNYESRNDEAEAILRAAIDTRKTEDASPAEFLERYEYGWILEDKGKVAEALEQYKLALRLPGRPSGENRVHLIQMYVNVARAASKTGDKALAKWAAQSAIALADSGEQDAYTRRVRPEAEKYLKDSQ